MLFQWVIEMYNEVVTYDFIDFPLEVQIQSFDVEHTKGTTFE